MTTLPTAPPAAPPAGAGPTGAYGLAEPTVADARASIVQVHGAAAAAAWADLLTAAGLTGTEEGRPAVERLVAAMPASPDAVTGLCARALRLRLTTFDRLSAVHALVQETAR